LLLKISENTVSSALLFLIRENIFMFQKKLRKVTKINKKIVKL